MILEFIASVGGIAITGGVAGWHLARRARPRADLCTGYVTESLLGVKEARADCRAHRCGVCVDGRCSFHCKQMCKCDIAI